MNRDEFLARLTLLIPLTYITWQVVALRIAEGFKARAWELLAAGFVVFEVITIATLLGLGMMWRIIFSWLGYALLAAAFHILRANMRSLRNKPHSRRSGDDE